MARVTKAFLEATLAARDAEVMDLRTKLSAAQKRVAQLEATITQDVRDRSSVRTMRETLDRCKALTMQGVPCEVRRGVLVHKVTGALL